MGIIKIMDTDLANKIAAGEVVESIFSVVKELVENSVDAGSASIKIELVESGLKQIKVTDDGKGMKKADALLAIQRHATSKVFNLHDLETINTLGFRGEALASIISVSMAKISTYDGKEATEIEIVDGKITKTSTGAMRRGTEITINNLFYNTPARLKYLKSLYAELADVVTYVNKMALAYPDIKFSLFNDKKQLLLTDGSNNLLKVINSIYGKEVSANMLELNASNDDYEITGFVSKPIITRSNRNAITIIVNGRNVRNTELNRAILEAYYTFIPENKTPIIVLNIDVDPRLVDVNIHPAKLDIKFSEKKELSRLIKKEITKLLRGTDLIPEVKVTKPEIETNYEELTLDLVREDTPEYTSEVKEVEINKIPEMYVSGFIHGTYILCENEYGMYLIDQHAAKERINYEYYLKKLGETGSEVTETLIPLTLEFTNAEYLVINERLNELSKLNLEVEEFGENTLKVNSHPIWLPTGYESDAIRKICDLVINLNRDFCKEKFNEKIAIMLSCKLAIKANDKISTEEAESLINDLRNCDNPYTCPHGRPTLVTFTNYELEKMFKRVSG